MRVVELYRGRPDFDVAGSSPSWPRNQKAEGKNPEARPLTEAEILRQIAERKANEVGDIPVPPKYASADFRESSFWKLRGKLDVPKERFIFYPGTERTPIRAPSSLGPAGIISSRRAPSPRITWR